MKKNKFISNNSTLIDIEKQKFLIMNDKYFNNNPNELNVFFYMLFNDYYTVYINNNSNNEQEDQEEQKNKR